MIFFRTQILKIAYPAALAAIVYCLISNGCSNPPEEAYTAFDEAKKMADEADVANKEKAFAYLDSAFYSIKHPRDIDIVERYCLKAEWYLKIRKDYGKALANIDSLLSVCESHLKDPLFAKNKVNGLYTKGTIFYTLKKYDEALSLFVLSKRAGEELKLDDCSYLGFSGIADLLFKQEKYLSAADQYLNNYYTEEHCRQDPWLKFVYMQGNLNSAGMCYEMAGLMDSAQYFFDSASRFIDIHGTEFPDHQSFIKLAKSVVLRGQASVAEKTGNRESAEELYLKSIEGTKAYYIEFTMQTKLKLAGLYLAEDNLPKAASLLRELERNTFDDDSFTESFYRLRAAYFSRLHNDRAANEYMQKYAALKDTLDARFRKFAKMDVNYEFKTKEQEIINQLLIKENKAKSFQLTAVILLSVLAILTGVLIWFNLRRAGRHVKELRNLNTIISRQNEDLQKAFNSLEQSHGENARITRMIAHDLKNPISGIKILASGMVKKVASQELRESFTLIMTTCSTSLELIESLLKEKRTLSSFHKEMVDMNQLLQYCVNLLQVKADEKKQRIQLQAGHVNILANRQKMWRVVSNILTNAIKFSPDNSTIYIKLTKKKQSVLLSVQDAGIGISNELKDKIFRFEPEASRTGTAGEESHGLGLLISRNIVEEHNGKLWFESEEGYGSIFFVELPCES